MTKSSISKKITAVAASSILAAALLSVSAPALAASEKCADIAKSGKNGCEANGHSCSGQSTYDNQPNEWVKVPAGTCGMIVSICTGAVEAPEGVSEKRLARYCKKVADQTDKTITGGRLV